MSLTLLPPLPPILQPPVQLGITWASRTAACAAGNTPPAVNFTFSKNPATLPFVPNAVPERSALLEVFGRTPDEVGPSRGHEVLDHEGRIRNPAPRLATTFPL
jgi:hypothetical protein